jgi:pyrroline-5-carboxylate reductase
VIVSIAAGVRAADISEAFGGRAVARVMPTTAVAIGLGTASIYRRHGRGPGRRPRPAGPQSPPRSISTTKT